MHTATTPNSLVSRFGYLLFGEGRQTTVYRMFGLFQLLRRIGHCTNSFDRFPKLTLEQRPQLFHHRLKHMHPSPSRQRHQ
jgi:hypothetical protein